MSNTAKFVNDWNSIFNFKIKESDLQKPTENFVFNVLVDYLKKFNMDIAPMINLFNNVNSEIRRKFKIKFCTYIDHIYKISCADNNFLYYDLIKPSPKKTTHMLKILLNYYLYVEMLQKETVGVAILKITELYRLLDKKTQYQLDIEAHKMKLNEIEEQTSRHNETMPKLVEQIDNLTCKEKDQVDKIAQLKDTIKNYDAILSQLKCKEEDLKCNIVSEEEIESLAANKALLEKAISEQEEIKRATLSNSDDRKKLIDKMEPVIEKIEMVTKNYLADDFNPLKEMKCKMQQVSQKYTAQEALNDKIKNMIESNLELTQKYEQEFLVKREHLSKIKEKADADVAQIERVIASEQMITARLKIDMQAVEKELDEQNSYGDFLLRSTQLVIDALCRNNMGHAK